MENEIVLKAKKVKAIFTDVDGVLTDGSMFYADGLNEHFKVFSVYDGVGVKIAKICNIPVFFISAKKSSLLHKRAGELGVERCYDGVENKKDILLNVLNDYNFKLDEIAYVGDDLVDIQILKIVGFPVAVNNAFEDVKRHAIYVTERNGGNGALREVIECIVKAKGLWERILVYFGG